MTDLRGERVDADKIWAACPNCAALLADKRRLADTVMAQVEEMKALRARNALLEKVVEAAMRCNPALNRICDEDIELARLIHEFKESR